MFFCVYDYGLYNEIFFCFVLMTVFSTDSSYLFGQSAGSLIFVLCLLGLVMIYAIYRYFWRKNGKMVNEALEEMQGLIGTHDDTEKYTVL